MWSSVTMHNLFCLSKLPFSLRQPWYIFQPCMTCRKPRAQLMGLRVWEAENGRVQECWFLERIVLHRHGQACRLLRNGEHRERTIEKRCRGLSRDVICEVHAQRFRPRTTLIKRIKWVVATSFGYSLRGTCVDKQRIALQLPMWCFYLKMFYYC